MPELVYIKNLLITRYEIWMLQRNPSWKSTTGVHPKARGFAGGYLLIGASSSCKQWKRSLLKLY